MIGRKTLGLGMYVAGALTGAGAYKAGESYVHRAQDGKAAIEASLDSIPGVDGNLPVIDGATTLTTLGGTAVTVAVGLPPVPPAQYESGIVCTGPVVKDIIVDAEHAGIQNEAGVFTLSILIAVNKARGFDAIRGTFTEDRAAMFAKDVARMNNIPVDASFNSDNFRPSEGTGYYFQLNCTDPFGPDPNARIA